MVSPQLFLKGGGGLKKLTQIVTVQTLDSEHDRAHVDTQSGCIMLSGTREGNDNKMIPSEIVVSSHEDWNKRMIRILTRGLFLTCTENSFLFCIHKQSRAVAFLLKERNTLTWKGGLFFMEANSHPPRSLA
jgi:hypothetical protein